jgi:hypothetical protein
LVVIRLGMLLSAGLRIMKVDLNLKRRGVRLVRLMMITTNVLLLLLRLGRRREEEEAGKVKTRRAQGRRHQ